MISITVRPDELKATTMLAVMQHLRRNGMPIDDTGKGQGKLVRDDRSVAGAIVFTYYEPGQ